jgi:3-hydroxyisobutyrate dehydrogenase-like beta-hydroxyacid dehydrogenase
MPTMQETEVGFIGLGLIGAPIAARLQQAGYRVKTIDRHSVKARECGYDTVATATELAADCDIVFTCLPSPEASLALYKGDGGLLERPRNNALFIELSTIDPKTAADLGTACKAAGSVFLDAPVSGGPNGARAGTLSVMVGGELADLERARPFLESFSSKCFHMGTVSAGSATKMCNQMLTGVTNVLVAETMVLGAKMGLDASRLFEVLHVSSGQSNSLDRVVPKFIIPRNFDAAFALDGIYKDMECITRTGKAFGARLLFAAVAQQLYEEARSAGLGAKDAASVYLTVERAAGLPEAGHLARGT